MVQKRSKNRQNRATPTFFCLTCTEILSQKYTHLPTDAKLFLFRKSQTYSSSTNTIISRYSHVLNYLPGPRTRALSHIAHPQRKRNHKQIRTNHSHIATKQTPCVSPLHVTTAQLRFLSKPQSRSPGSECFQAPGYPPLLILCKANAASKNSGVLNNLGVLLLSKDNNIVLIYNSV